MRALFGRRRLVPEQMSPALLNLRYVPYMNHSMPKVASRPAHPNVPILNKCGLFISAPTIESALKAVIVSERKKPMPNHV